MLNVKFDNYDIYYQNWSPAYAVHGLVIYQVVPGRFCHLQGYLHKAMEG